MSEDTQTNPRKTNNPFGRIFALFTRPRQFFASDPGGWKLPMLALSLTLALQTAVGGYFRARAAAMGEIALPPALQWL